MARGMFLKKKAKSDGSQRSMNTYDVNLDGFFATEVGRVLGGRSSMCLGTAQYYLLGDAVLHLSACGKNMLFRMPASVEGVAWQ